MSNQMKKNKITLLSLTDIAQVAAAGCNCQCRLSLSFLFYMTDPLYAISHYGTDGVGKHGETIAVGPTATLHDCTNICISHKMLYQACPDTMPQLDNSKISTSSK